MEDFHESGRNQIGLDLFQLEETSMEDFRESRLEMNLVGLELLLRSNEYFALLFVFAPARQYSTFIGRDGGEIHGRLLCIPANMI